MASFEVAEDEERILDRHGDELFAGYEEAGRKVDPDRVMFWEVMGTLRWGIMCCGMMQRFRAGPDHSMERAMIGRRASYLLGTVTLTVSTVLYVLLWEVEAAAARASCHPKALAPSVRH